MQMYDPPHPGEIIRQDCLEPLHLTVTAAWLGVSRQSLSELLNGHNGLSAEMAIRLEKAGWSNAETWPGIRLAHDRFQAKRNADAITVRPYPVHELPAST